MRSGSLALAVRLDELFLKSETWRMLVLSMMSYDSKMIYPDELTMTEHMRTSANFSTPPSPGQWMGLWLLPWTTEQGGVRKVVLSVLERPLDVIMWTVTLYLQENIRPGRFM